MLATEPNPKCIFSTMVIMGSHQIIMSKYATSSDTCTWNYYYEISKNITTSHDALFSSRIYCVANVIKLNPDLVIMMKH